MKFKLAVQTELQCTKPQISSSQLNSLEATIRDIGLARFVGRINSGVIPEHEGYAAVERFLAHEKERPLLSRVTQAVLGRPNSYERR